MFLPILEPCNLAERDRSGSTKGMRVFKLLSCNILHRPWLALLIAIVPLLATAAHAQSVSSSLGTPAPGRLAVDSASCPNGRISQVLIDNHSIFDPEEIAEEQRFDWAYRLVNALHIRTRPPFIRRELLFGPNSCYDPLLLAESERLLRGYPFIAQANVFGLLQPDRTWHVVVETQDEWTTKLTLGVSWDGSVRFEKLALTEENLLGRGVLLGGFVREREQERELGLTLALPRTGGSRTDTRLSWGRTRRGEFFEQGFHYPFVGEVGRVAGRQRFLRRPASFPFSLGAKRDRTQATPTHVLLPMDEERLELTVAGRLGRPGSLTIFGLGFSNESLAFPGFPETVEIALDEDFDDPRPGDSLTIESVRHQTAHSPGMRINFLIGQRNVRFERFRGLDALRGTQDVALGTDLALTVGHSFGATSALSGQDAPESLYFRFRAAAGAAPGAFLILLAGGIEGRQISSGDAANNEWKDLLSELTLMSYWQPRDWSRHTFLARVAGVGGWDVTHPFQLTLGGSTGVRGYDFNALPVGRRVVFSIEDRVYLGWPWPDLFDLGVTVFSDIGAGWAGDVPFGADTGWRGTLGTGLRLGFPTGSRGVARVDLAWPVRSEGFGAPHFRVTFDDPIGLARGLVDNQLARSRRLPIGPDLFRVQQP